MNTNYLIYSEKMGKNTIDTLTELPRKGSNFLDSVPHIRQLTSF